MHGRVKEFLKKHFTKRFIVIQLADIVIAVIIFMALSGVVKLSYCFIAVGIYAAISLVIWIVKVGKKIRKGE